jgi:serine phosphatase RsbU (regulator of sigma subunit)
MTDQTDKKIYWLEGVTKKEVIESLTDAKPSIFRNQKNRKVLVAMLSLSIILLSMTIFIEQPKIKSYAEFILMAAIVIFYLILRKAVRLLADAPTELLDERQIKLRNNAYLYAYRWMIYIAIAYFVLYILVGSQVSNSIVPEFKPHISSSLFSICAWMAVLPSMVIAWVTPSEDND